MSAAFLLAWSPYGIVSMVAYYGNFGQAIPAAVYALPCLFAKCVTVCHPFVYVFPCHSMRKDLNRIVCGGRLHALLSVSQNPNEVHPLKKIPCGHKHERHEVDEPCLVCNVPYSAHEDH